MPPRALISATARSAPFLKFVPTVAPPPDSSPTFAILIGPPVWANATPPRLAARATAPAIFHAFISDILPLAPARAVSGSLGAPLPPFLARDGFFLRRSEACPKSCPGATEAAGGRKSDRFPQGPRLGGPSQARERRLEIVARGRQDPALLLAREPGNGAVPEVEDLGARQVLDQVAFEERRRDRPA